MTELERKRSIKRKREKKKRQIILIGIIIALIILITTVIGKTVTASKTKESGATVENGVVKNTDNDILFVNLEQNIEQNAVEENLLEENIVEENTQQETESPRTDRNGKKYRLEVNCTQNVVNVYERDENGEYNNCVKVMLCSIGTATPRSGTFGLKKYGWEWKGLQGDVYGQYATQITGNILFHSVPYTEKYNNASLEYWEYDKLGTPASLGCVRLTVQNAKWIYDNCENGTKVMFYEDSNPGPLGKPSERKISSEENYRNWDPTDPDSNNPWKNYSKEPDKPAIKDDEDENTENSNNENKNIENEEKQNTENSAENKEENIVQNIIENKETDKPAENIEENSKK